MNVWNEEVRSGLMWNEEVRSGLMWNEEVRSGLILVVVGRGSRL
jgi:hypothetical protein